MFYQSYQPTPALQPFVSRYYIMEDDARLHPGLTLSVPANGYAALVLNYGNRLTRVEDDRPDELLPAHFITGPATRPSTLQLNPRTGIVGVILKGAGFLRLFKISASEVLDRRVPLDDVLGTATERLSQQLREARRPGEKIAVIETFLLRQMNEHALEADWVDHAAGIILQRKGRVNMDALAAHLNVCARHLRRQFKARTGLNPKLFARLKRFNYANLLLTQRPELDCQDLIYLAGFYDQAHFIKEFTQFAGTRPSQVVRQHSVWRDRMKTTS